MLTVYNITMEIPIDALFLIPTIGALALVGVIAYDTVITLRHKNKKIQNGFRLQNI
jgi:hypothetical protein